MPRLYAVDTGEPIGEISAAQLQFLVDQLEEEDGVDRDYYISRDTLEMFRELNGDEALITMLERALGDKEDMDIRWE